MSKLTNEQLAFAIADSLREKGLIYSSKTFEASELISSKLKNYRHKVDQKKQAESPRGSTQCGFPSDDMISLQQLASGDANLDIIYRHQFVQNERIESVKKEKLRSDSKLFEYEASHTPILEGTMTGTIYLPVKEHGEVCVQLFVVGEDGNFNFTPVGTPVNYAFEGELDCKTGKITLKWDHYMSSELSHHVVVSYEYDMECNV